MPNRSASVFGVVQGLADFYGQFFTPVGLAQQLDARVQTPVMDDRVFSIAGVVTLIG
jgi:hypothetical protein